jgi:hypothetical protein
MRMSLSGVVCLIVVASAACAAPAADEFRPETIIALERGALERWGKGDPAGYFELFAPEMTYFDPTTAARIDGRDALVAMLKPYTGKIAVGRFDMQKPVVQRRGDTAVLTFNLLSYRTEAGQEKVVARWNSTEIYSRIDSTWKLTHSHWSYIKPELKVAVTEVQ